MIKTGLAYLATHPGLRETTAATTIAFATVGLLTIGFPRFARELGHDPEVAGAMWALLAVGSGIGALAYPRIQRRFRTAAIVGTSMCGLGILVASWPFAGTLTTALTLVGLAGLFDGPHLAGVFSIRQRLTPPHLLTQIFMTAASLKIAAFAMGAAFAAPMLDLFGVRSTLLVVAAAHVTGGLLILRVRDVIDEPDAVAMGTDEPLGTP